MKKSLVLAMAMAMGVTASAYAANPFSDVPSGHWAYDSVNKLAAAGVVDGYVDGTYGGDKLMTRYEMAQIVAKAMAKGANVDKLAAEFADELDTLGVRVANLEKKADNVKITGELRYHYGDHEYEDGAAPTGKNESVIRSRIYVNGQINDDWKYTGMIENQQDLLDNAGNENTYFQRAYVNGKLGGTKVQAGRYSLKVAEGNLYDGRFDGVQASYGKDVKLTVGYGKASNEKDNSKVSKAGDTVYAELYGKVGALDMMGGYYNFSDVSSTLDADKNFVESGKDQKVWAVGANYAFSKDFKLGAMYLNGDVDGYENKDDDGFVITAKYAGAKASAPGTWGVTAKYYDQGYSTVLKHTMDGDYGHVNSKTSEGFKGYSLAADYTFAKNIVGLVQWYDLEGKNDKTEAQTLWGQVTFLF